MLHGEFCEGNRMMNGDEAVLWIMMQTSIFERSSSSRQNACGDNVARREEDSLT